MTIRPERSEDASRVRHVNELAFGQPMEADLVERLRQACTDSLSLVAEDDAVVGHILFTPVVIESEERVFETCAYVLLNPVKAGLCDRVEDWPWSYSRYGLYAT